MSAGLVVWVHHGPIYKRGSQEARAASGIITHIYDIYEFGLGSRGKLAYGHGDDFDSIICEFWCKKWAETTKKN